MKKPATIAAVSLLLTLAACGDDKPDPIPSSSASPTPSVSVSPAPSEPKLTEEQKAEYKAALDRYDSFRDFEASLSQKPEVTDATVRSAMEYMTLEGADSLSNALDELVRNEAHVEGRRTRAWIAPEKVSAREIVLRECETPGTWVLVGKNGAEAPATTNTVTRVTLEQIKGRWYINSAKAAGKC